MKIPRRQTFGLLAAAAIPSRAETLPGWQPGLLDIHHISTGRGSTAFFILPDGSSLLVDAGAQYPTPVMDKFATAPKPNGQRRPGEWIARYITRHLKPFRTPAIDTFLLTHFHSDHMGEVVPGLPKSKKGDYVLTGIADVAEVLPVSRLVDRGYPDYAYPTPVNDPHTANYRGFARAAANAGTVVERFRVGSSRQFQLQRATNYPDFQIRNLAANGEVWTGQGEATKQLFPPPNTLPANLQPGENMCSIAFKLSFGAFDYFGGGDQCQDTRYGKYPWRDIETPTAEVSGPVEVALVNHHGYVDAACPGWVKALQARAYVIHGWDSAHPTMPALHNMLSEDLYAGPRDLFQTALKPENAIAIRRLSELKGKDGHVMIRVSPGGKDFRIFLTANDDESDRVLASFGPYTCR